MQCYLKGAQNEIEHHPDLRVDVVWNEGKKDVVDPKERNQQQCGFSQSPKKVEKEEREDKTLLKSPIHSRLEY